MFSGGYRNLEGEGCNTGVQSASENLYDHAHFQSQDIVSLEAWHYYILCSAVHLNS